MTAGVGEQVTDADLVADYRRNPELFTAVYDRYLHDIHRYVAGRLDTQMAEDIAAETFLLAFDQRDRFDPGKGGLRPWLFGFATNLVARHRRKEARHYKALARLDPAPVVEGHENRVVTSVTAQPYLAMALASLNGGERDVLLLLALGQLSYNEIAQALGISLGTVGSRLNRARAKIQILRDKETTHE
ncbi:RNA polymerase sigma factor [Streptosporangium lutulentum]|uniref:RNA polymerase sigma-70 factor (ECF subfamily) n=1 Tax=Streptosporangium lutulentum TaxID=1461250 RepID=A0ABT9QTX2_9ACTN|nr:RNA polymerase sigma factor [Streptosporangium lutulentum]MDP9850168.1 RNA polymerase sigma-70 factor (ECF subfamily) [Streptosporangium lutulentum]